MENEPEHYPCVRREASGSCGEIRFSLVDVRNGQVVASWVEKDEDGSWGEDCYNRDENENYSGSSRAKMVDPCSVYVSNLEPWLTKEDLVQYFAVVGEILRVTLLRSRKKETRTGSAFVMFSEQDAANRALFLDRSMFRGRMISVKQKLYADQGGEGNEDPDMDPLSVFIGNLDHNVTSLDLAELLQQFGVIDKVTILRNRKTGEHKGAAYAQFRDNEGRERALSLDGCLIGRKCVKIRRKRRTVSVDDDIFSKKRVRVDSSDDEEEDSRVHEASSIFVGNLDPRTKKDDLEEHFQSTGDIVRVSILKGNRAAYIEFKESWSVEGALCKNGSKLGGNVLKVNRKLLKVK